MLNKKNIAKAMAVATIAAPVATTTTIFADVVDNTQAEEIKVLKEKVYEILNARYTQNQNLTTGASVAGTRVYDKITVTTNSSVEFTNYSDFVKFFDTNFAKMNNGDVLKVSYTSTNGVSEIKGFEGEISDAIVAKYALVGTTKDELINEVIAANEVRDINGTASIDDKGEVLAVGAKISAGVEADGKVYVKIPVSNGYITVKNGDQELDLSKPKYKVVDGYYVDAKGNNIKKFVQADEHGYDKFVEEMTAIGGVVEGYYPVLESEASTKSDTIAIVKQDASVEKEDLTVSDLYEAAAGRLTIKGNELVNAIRDMIEDENTDNLLVKDTDNMRTRIVTLDAAGEVIADKNTEDHDLEMDDIADLIDADNVKTVKVIVETTKDEKSNDPQDWAPVYEATITAGRNESLDSLVDAFNGKLQMPLAAGMDRYATAVETSKQGWTTTDAVVLVSGDSSKLVDGLAATPLAAQEKAPILLTKKDSLPEETLKEIKRLEAKEVIIVGGVNSVSEELATELAKTHGLKVERLGGDTRYETSLAVAERMVADKKQATAALDHVFVVGGKGEADALSASAIAAKLEAPILLTPANELDKDVKHFINKNIKDENNEADVYVVGGVNSVSSAVQTELLSISPVNELTNKVEVKRLAGDGRQETNAAVINEFADELTNIVIAKSDNKGMVDALAAGALAVQNDAHIVLATNELVDDQEDALAKVAGTSTPKTAEKVQVGYNVGKSVVKFINNLFTR